MQDYNRHLKHLENAARGDGVDHILQKYQVDVIIGPADSFLTSMATGSGWCHVKYFIMIFGLFSYRISRGRDATIVPRL